MHKYLLPKNLTRFCSGRFEASHIVFFERIIAELGSPRIPLQKKRFGHKEVYVCDADYGRHYHRLIFEKIDLEGECVYALRDIAWIHDYAKALRWAPWGSMLQKDIPSEYMLVEGDTPEILSNSNQMVQYKDIWYELTS